MSKCNCSCGCAQNNSVKNVYACSGASNVGKLSYDLAIELHKNGDFKLGCSAGIGADICSFVDSADKSQSLLIDGCPVACLKTMFDNKKIENYDHIVLTEMGIKKEGNFTYEESLIPRLIAEIKEMGL